ncbi:MAG TPA: class D sortase [Terriglobales bacterium]|jgi:sortase A
MPPLPAQPPRRKRPALRWARWLFLVLGVALLGYVGYTFLDAELFQAYENWRLNQAVEKSSTPSAVAQPQVLPASLSPRDEGRRTTVAPGSVLGRIEISRIGISVIIVEGIGRRSLQRAVGHIPGTAFPGEQGNVAISAHRDTFFRPLKDIRKDDEITLTTANGSYRYRVDSMKVVAEEDTEVLNDSGASVLTLVTCYPFYYVGPAPKRFVVRARLN